MSEYKDMGIVESLDALRMVLADLFYASVEYQHDGDFQDSRAYAEAFYGLAALYRNHGIPLPEPFDGTKSLRELATEYLRVLEEREAEDDDDESGGFTMPAETVEDDEGPWLT